MRSARIKNAYDRVTPTPEAVDAMKQQILMCAEQKPIKAKHLLRRVVLIAACVVLLLSIGTVGYGTYRKWSLPEPEYYDYDGLGVHDVHSTEEYELEEVEPEAQPLSDEDFIQQSVSLLDSIGLEDVATEAMSVSRQENVLYGREEVEVTFTRAEIQTSVTYNADDGALLSMHSTDWEEDVDEPVCQTEAEAQALAEKYYAILPVRQGYELIGHTEYDEQYYSYEFCYKVNEDLFNAYQMVRIGVNPVTGRLCGCNVFDFPLVDDHEPGDEPLTQEQAEEIVRNCGKMNVDTYQLISAKVEVVLPNWMFSDKEPASINYRKSKVSRLAWVLTYEDTDSEFEDKVYVDVDYYTGEILGGDMTG